MMKIIIQGTPIAKKRPRFVRRGDKVGTYNPQQTEESRWLWEAKQQIKKCINGPVLVRLHFFFGRPKSHYGMGKNKETLKKSAPFTHTQKPDLDNLVKFALDCLNSVAFRDDAQIIQISAGKWWTNDSGLTNIIVEEKI